MFQSRTSQWILIILAALFLVFLACVLFVSYLNGQKQETVGRITTTIPVYHQYNNGVHTYVGSVDTPTPCYSVSGETLVAESFPEKVDIKLEVKDEGGVCAQVITAKRFKVSFQASNQAYIKSFLNGNPVLFKVTEVPATTNIDNLTI